MIISASHTLAIHFYILMTQKYRISKTIFEGYSIAVKAQPATYLYFKSRLRILWLSQTWSIIQQVKFYMQ